MKKLLIIFILSLSIFNSQLSIASVVSDAAVALAVGSWVEITTTNPSAVLSASNGGSLIEYMNKMGYDPVNKKVMFCGSSHHGTFEGKCPVYDVASNTWTDGGLPPGNTASGCSSGPCVPHGYDWNTADTTRGHFYYLGSNTNTLDRFNLATNTWTQFAMPSGFAASFYGGVEYVKEMDRVIVYRGSTGTCWNFNPATTTFSASLSCGLPGDGSSDSNLIYSKHGYAYFTPNGGSETRFYRYNATNTLTSLAATPYANGQQKASMISDPNTGRPLYFADTVNGNGHIWVLTNDTDGTWTDTGITSKRTGMDPNWYAIAPLPDYGVIMYVTMVGPGQIHTWLYRYSSSTPLSAPPTATITSPTSSPTYNNGATANVNLGGTASDDVAVTSVTWSNDRGGSGTATGTTSWNISNIALQSGTNTITVSARDADNQTGSDTIAVVYTPAVAGGQLPIPSLIDERNTYTSWGWTWNPTVEYPLASANITADVATISDPHGQLEGDDLWTNVMQTRRRPLEGGWISRVNAFVTFYKNQFCLLVPIGSSNCDGFNGDHAFGWGLVDYYLYTCATSTCDAASLTAAERIAAEVERIWGMGPNGTKDVNYAQCTVNENACMWGGQRMAGRQLILLTRLAEVCATATCANNTAGTRWTTLRDAIFNAMISKTENPAGGIKYGWNTTWGMYFQTDSAYGVGVDELLAAYGYTGANGSYAQGARVVESFQIAQVTEGFWQYYRVTKNATARARLISMASFIFNYGMDPTLQLSGDFFGVVNGTAWNAVSQTRNSAPAGDPTYTFTMTNALVYGYKLTGATAYLTKAKQFFNCGYHAVYGGVTPCNTSLTTTDHFTDTWCGISGQPVCNTASTFNRQKGELQYTYQIFENGGLPSVEGTPAPQFPVAFKISQLPIKIETNQSVKLGLQ